MRHIRITLLVSTLLIFLLPACNVSSYFSEGSEAGVETQVAEDPQAENATVEAESGEEVSQAQSAFETPPIRQPV